MSVNHDDGATVPHARPDVASARFELACVAGQDVGAVLAIGPDQGGRAHVGTSATCELRLDDRHVSRRHLAAELDGARLRVSDLGSTNGTSINGVAIVEALLSGGEEIRLGESILAVRRADILTASDRAGPLRFGRTHGASPAMRRIFERCAALATSDLPVLIEGETGTGKELLAECIHEEGPRAGQPFVVLDAALLPTQGADVVLFGCEAGAVPLADEARAGLFEQADGGTLLIDEPADLAPDVQRKLVRAVERGAVQRVGSARPRQVDVRIIATSRGDMDRAVEEGRLREDLFYRLAGVRIELPPLRKRREDIAHLAARALADLRPGAQHAALAPEVLARLEAAAWPGNVRELLYAVAAFAVAGDAERRDLTPAPAVAAPGAGEGGLESLIRAGLTWSETRQRMLADLERRYVERVLTTHGGNVGRAAAASGMAHRSFQALKAKRRRT